MKRIIQILILTLIPLMGFSQIDKLLKNKNFYCGIMLGINNSKFRNESQDLNYGTRPFLGLYAKYRIVKRLYIKSSAVYSIKNSKSSRSYLNLENQYFDFNFTPQFQINKDIFIHAGISHSYLIAAKQIVFCGDKSNGVKRIDYEGYNSETSIATGIEFKFQNNVNFEFNYYIPISKSNIKNFQLALDILLNKKEKKKESFKQKLRRKSKEQINQLKKGTLLVRLKTSEKSIEALRKIGKTTLADKLEKQQKFKNIKIISAFKKHLNFCKVAFFYSNNSKEVLSKKYKNIFLNDSLMVDNSIKIDTTNSIFIVDFNAIEQDTTKYFSRYRYDRNDNGAYKKHKSYYAGPDLKLYALIIKDENSFQLSKPFPYYFRATNFSLKKRPKKSLLPSEFFQERIEKSYNKTVKKLNTKLTNYYDKNHY